MRSHLVQSLVEELTSLQCLPGHLLLLPPHVPLLLSGSHKSLQSLHHLLISLERSEYRQHITLHNGYTKLCQAVSDCVLLVLAVSTLPPASLS